MKVKITAQYSTSVTREVEVDDDFNPMCSDLGDLWDKNGGGRLSREETEEANANLQFDDVWLVRNDKNEEMYAN